MKRSGCNVSELAIVNAGDDVGAGNLARTFGVVSLVKLNLTVFGGCRPRDCGSQLGTTKFWSLRFVSVGSTQPYSADQ